MNQRWFDEIWKLYPRKVGKRAAIRHFSGTVKTLYDFDDIKKALANYLSSDRVKRGFIQDGSTWFNNWQDWIDYKEVSKVEVKKTKHCIYKGHEYKVCYEDCKGCAEAKKGVEHG